MFERFLVVKIKPGQENNLSEIETFIQDQSEDVDTTPVVDTIAELIGGKKQFEIAWSQFDRAMQNAIPRDIYESCSHCQGKTSKSSGLKCEKYYFQMRLTFEYAAKEYIKFINTNSDILHSEFDFVSLTCEFFNNFGFKLGEAAFDRKEFSKKIQLAYYGEIEKVISRVKPLNGLELITELWTKFNRQKTEHKTIKGLQTYLIDGPIEFCALKHNELKREIELEKLGGTSLKEKREKRNRKTSKHLKGPTAMVIAYIIYYIYVSDDPSPIPFEPTQQFWEYWSKKFERDIKNIRTEYNKINKDTPYRLQKSREKKIHDAIKYLSEKQYFEAIKLAQNELLHLN